MLCSVVIIDIIRDLTPGIIIGSGTLNPTKSPIFPSCSPTPSPVIVNQCKPECNENTETISSARQWNVFGIILIGVVVAITE